MFKTPNLFGLIRWHHNNKSQDGLVRHTIDSKAWRHIDENSWPKFAANPHNLQLGLVLNYNLLLWLITKKLFVMHLLLVPRKEIVKNKNIDVYMASLLEFWQGVHAWDVTRPIGDCRFTMHALLLWSIHDLLAHGLLAGQVTKGFKGCPTCGPNTSSCHS